jgi:hypothetical protein
MAAKSTGYSNKLDQVDLVLNKELQPNSRSSFFEVIWRLNNSPGKMNHSNYTDVYMSDSWIVDLPNLRTTWRISCSPRVRDIVGKHWVKLDVTLHLSDASSTHGFDISVGVLDDDGEEDIWETFEVTNDQEELLFTTAKLQVRNANLSSYKFLPKFQIFH